MARALDLPPRVRRAYKFLRAPRGLPLPLLPLPRALFLFLFYLCRFLAPPTPRHHAAAPPGILGLPWRPRAPLRRLLRGDPLQRVRLGLGTFETARAYDAAAWTLGRPRTQMNFNDVNTREQAQAVAPPPRLIIDADRQEHRCRQRRLLIAEEDMCVHGSVSPKIDIFSFGVLVLEIITRRKNCSSDYGDTVNLISDVWNYWTKGTISQMMDESLNGYPRSQALRCVHIGLLCVQPDPDDRPQISAVIFMLTRDTMELQPPAQPAFFFGTESPSPASPRYGQRRYMHGRSDLVPEDDVSWNGVTITELYPR